MLSCNSSLKILELKRNSEMKKIKVALHCQLFLFRIMKQVSCSITFFCACFDSHNCLPCKINEHIMGMKRKRFSTIRDGTKRMIIQTVEREI